LKSCAENFVSAEAYVDGCVSPVCVDSPAIADTLRWAAGGFNGSLFGLAPNSFAYKLQPSLSLASREALRRIERSKNSAESIQKTFSESIRKRCIDAGITLAVDAAVFKHFGATIGADRWPALKTLH
jgi:hypothetical protein